MAETGINLIPEDYRRERFRSQMVVKAARVGKLAALGSLILTLLLGGGYLYVDRSQNQLAAAIDEEASLVESLSAYQDQSFVLGRKGSLTAQTLKDRVYYSLLMASLQPSVPATVTLTNLAIVSPNQFILGGEAVNYLSLADLVEDLLDDSQQKEFFTAVRLTQVNLKKETGLIQFSMEVDTNAAKLKKSLW